MVHQPACILPDAPLCLSLCHLAEGAYTIRLLFVSVVYSVSSHSWKMYWYTLVEQVFIVRIYWKTESIKLCQQQILGKFGGQHPPSKYCIWALSKKLETKGTLLDELTGGRPKTSGETIQNVKDQLQASPKKSLRRLSQELGLSRSTCQRAAKKAKLHAYRISMLQELKEPDQVKGVAYCRWFQTHLKENPGILDYTWFLDEAWFHLSGYVNSQNSRIWASENPNTIHEEPPFIQRRLVFRVGCPGGA